MHEYDEECLEIFRIRQAQLLGKDVIETADEADEFLSDCMAQVLGSLREVREYMDESGMDISGMSDEEIVEQCEVFPLPSGRFLVVEG